MVVYGYRSGELPGPLLLVIGFLWLDVEKIAGESGIKKARPGTRDGLQCFTVR
jgi:hypothetical protein